MNIDFSVVLTSQDVCIVIARLLITVLLRSCNWYQSPKGHWLVWPNPLSVYARITGLPEKTGQRLASVSAEGVPRNLSNLLDIISHVGSHSKLSLNVFFYERIICICLQVNTNISTGVLLSLVCHTNQILYVLMSNNIYELFNVTH